ncbi:MAG: SEC-C metal-binding domain-containing protein, partial [Actinomycetota bacterium]|nr:SEC-C metal-binding domain-containing protein [Actinomycetota bacterium]
DYVTYIYRIENIEVPDQQEIENLSYSGGGEEPDPQPKTPRRNEKVGRNDPCPCGSGKKFKKCGLLDTPEHQRMMRESGPAAQTG